MWTCTGKWDVLNYNVNWSSINDMMHWYYMMFSFCFVGLFKKWTQQILNQCQKHWTYCGDNGGCKDDRVHPVPRVAVLFSSDGHTLARSLWRKLKGLNTNLRTKKNFYKQLLLLFFSWFISMTDYCLSLERKKKLAHTSGCSVRDSTCLLHARAPQLWH